MSEEVEEFYDNPEHYYLLLDEANEELVILRKIAHLANEYRKHKSHEVSLEMQAKAMRWYNVYGAKR